MGPQGCGKGTQLELLKKYISAEDDSSSVFYFATGKGFRDFATKNGFSNNLSKDIMLRGELQPLFLTIWMWASAFLSGLKENQHILIDGYPRKVTEAEVLDSAFKFYGRNEVIVILFSLSKQTTIERMRSRNRSDDTDEAIEIRLKSFEENTIPIIEWYKKKDGYTVINIDAEPSIEEIHQTIIKTLNS